VAYEKKLERANELHDIIEKSKAELETLFGNADAPRRGRPPKEHREPAEPPATPTTPPAL
jgi:hypothetical protein